MKRCLGVFLTGVLMLSLAGFAQAAKPMTMDIGHVLANETPTGQAAIEFANVMKTLSDGTITVNVYPSSQLGSEREQLESCQLGSLDLTLGATASLVPFDKSWMVFDAPFLFTTYENAYQTVDSKWGQDMLASLKAQNMLGLGFVDAGFGEITTRTKELKSPADLKGLNIRCLESVGYISALKAFGANPVQTATSEVYSMLQNGTVDGTVNPAGTVYSFSFYEHAKFMSTFHSWYCPVVIVISLQRWNSLTPEQQGWVAEAAKKASIRSREVRQEMEGGWIEAMNKAGLTATKVTPEEYAVWKEFCEKNIYPSLVPSAIPQKLWDDFRAAAK